MQCDMGRETPVVQGYCQGVAPTTGMRHSLDPLQGMAFVHSLGFAHRDLKSQNVLYDIETGRAKVTAKCAACA